MKQELQDAAYAYALSKIKRLDDSRLIQIISSFSTPTELLDASPQTLEEKLGPELCGIVAHSLRQRWPSLWDTASEVMQRHISKGIVPISIADLRYPPFLRLISNPPSILYAMGDISVLSQVDAVAVVGTRRPTARGKKVAQRIGSDFAAHGYVIVSGLAQGIDTQAHRGALDARGRTVAVLGTPLDRIYPAENRALAEEIAHTSGVLLSEYALGQTVFRSAFIQRDRIQSGLSLAVIAVQTDVTGGTMHTVRFAHQQQRLVLCPRPEARSANAKQYAGVLELIRSRGAHEFRHKDYPAIFRMLRESKERLSANLYRSTGATGREAQGTPKQRGFEFGH